MGTTPMVTGKHSLYNWLSRFFGGGGETVCYFHPQSLYVFQILIAHRVLRESHQPSPLSIISGQMKHYDIYRYFFVRCDCRLSRESFTVTTGVALTTGPGSAKENYGEWINLNPKP